MAEWVVLELSSKADGEDPEIVRASIRHLLRDAEIFIPASIVQQGGERVVHYLLEGYAFIRKAHPAERYFRLEGSKYIQSIVTHTNSKPDSRERTRVLSCVQQSDIDKFRSQIRVQEDQGITVSDLVVITSGPYKNLKAIVIEDIPEQDAVQVHVQLRSKQSLVTLPRAFLKLAEKAAKPPFHDRKVALHAWLDAALFVLKWQPVDIGPLFHEWLYIQGVVELASQVHALAIDLDAQPLMLAEQRYRQVLAWTLKTHSLHTKLHTIAWLPEKEPLQVLFAEYQKIVDWQQRAHSLSAYVFLGCSDPLPQNTLQGIFLEWAWAGDALSRLLSLLHQIERIEQNMAAGGVQNIIIDGHNLAVRCAMAPGLSELTDDQGRPTGAIVGFLNTLVRLKKRFAGADFYVTWDGSSQRRKAMFAGYKADRGEPKAVFEVVWLQQFLPYIGVHQAWNPKEEADDIIATLVSGELAGQSNLIFTNDRDLLQLVSSDTSVLIPAVGAGKERLMQTEDVCRDYGVLPSHMPQLRALAGDDSDTIPGCPKCGLKTAAKLINYYGTVKNLMASNMAGLAKGLTANLRASEKQVHLNVNLMTLIGDIPIERTNPNADVDVSIAKLQEIQVRSDLIRSAFFGDS